MTGIVTATAIERPAIFDAESVLAILADRKSQTRRALKVQPPPGTLRLDPWLDLDREWQYERGRPLWASTEADGTRRRYGCPYGKPGDRLWVREGFAIVPRTAYRASVGVQQMIRPDDPYDHDAAIYRAGWDRAGSQPWRSPIHMPRWASRLTLEVVSIRAERIQVITEADAIAEGIVCEPDRLGPQYGSTPGQMTNRTAYAAFARRWDALNKARGFGWQTNCWIWVVTFNRLEGVH